MLIRLLFVSCLFICLQVTAADITTDLSTAPEVLNPELLNQARTIVGDMVKDKQPEEILAMANEIALALNQESVCGAEGIQAMVEAGIPFESAYQSIIKACNIQGTELAALNRSLSPGLTGQVGGPGGEVSP